jgi:hypothetical protein
MIRAVQNFEKAKLQLTVELQVGQEKDVATCQEEGQSDPVWKRQEFETQNRIYDLNEEINARIEEIRCARFPQQEQEQEQEE